MGFWDDLGDAVGSAAGAIGDAVEGVVDTVTDTVEDVVDTVVDGAQDGLAWANGWLCQNAGQVGCRIGNVVLGGISGALEGVQDVADEGFDIAHDLGGAVGDLLSGDVAGFLGELVNGVSDLVEGLLDVGRLVTLGTVVGGVRDAWQADDLRTFVEDLLAKRFASDPDQLARIRDHLGLDGISWGLPLQATHKVFRLDSDTAPLWEWQQQGEIDLYAMAGLASGDSFDVRRRRTMVRSVSDDGIEGSFPISRWTLSHYLDSSGKEGRIRVYALDPGAVKDFVQVATAKFERLGIRLQWNGGGRFDYSPALDAHDITTLDELHFNRARQGTYLVDSGLKPAGGEQCNLLALAAFGFVTGLGQTSGRDIAEGPAAAGCAVTPDRTDSCCISVESGTGAGVVYHDEWPQAIFRYVLAHECGHYVGLCHYGHDGFQNIMYTPAPEAHLHWYDWGLFRYYLDNEPSFTLDDAENVWRFLVAQLVGCLDPGPIIL